MQRSCAIGKWGKFVTEICNGKHRIVMDYFFTQLIIKWYRHGFAPIKNLWTAVIISAFCNFIYLLKHNICLKILKLQAIVCRLTTFFLLNSELFFFPKNFNGRFFPSERIYNKLFVALVLSAAVIISFYDLIKSILLIYFKIYWYVWRVLRGGNIVRARLYKWKMFKVSSRGVRKAFFRSFGA